jgi:hypothetical protein
MHRAMTISPALITDCPEAPSFRASILTMILHEACETAGGISQLANLLAVPPLILARWLDGEEKAPAAIYRACVDIVLLHERDLNDPLAPGSARSPEN